MSKSTKNSKSYQTLDASPAKRLVCYDESDTLLQDHKPQKKCQGKSCKDPHITSVKDVSSETPVTTINIDRPLDTHSPTTNKKEACRHHTKSWLAYPFVLYFPASGQYPPFYLDQREQFNINNLMFITLLVLIMIMIQNTAYCYVNDIKKRIDHKFYLRQLSVNSLLELVRDPMLAQSMKEVQSEHPRLASKIQDYILKVRNYCTNLNSSELTYPEFYKLLIYISNLMRWDPQLVLLGSYSESVFHKYYHFTKGNSYVKQCEHILDLMYNSPSKSEVLAAHHLKERTSLDAPDKTVAGSSDNQRGPTGNNT